MYAWHVCCRVATKRLLDGADARLRRQLEETEVPAGVSVDLQHMANTTSENRFWVFARPNMQNKQPRHFFWHCPSTLPLLSAAMDNK